MKRLLAGIVLTAVTGTLAACGSSDSPSPSSSAGSSDPIEIGSWSALSGPFAPSGLQSAAGVSAAVEEINASGGINGRMINLTALDNAYDPQQTIQAARKLVGEHDVVAIVGPQGTGGTAAAFPYVLDQSKVPILFPYGGTADWYTPPKPGLFGAQTLYLEQGKNLAEWALENGAKNIVVVHNDPQASVDVADQIVATAQAADPGVETTKVSVKLNTTDYSPIVAQVKEESPDAVVLILTIPEGAAYLKQAELQGVTADTYGFSVLADPGVLTLAGDAAAGFHTLSVTKLPTDTADPAVAAYVAALEKYAPDQEPSFFSIFTYAGTMAFADVLKGIEGDITPESISEAMESSGSIDTGLLPPLTFSATQHLGNNQVVRLTVEDGAFTAEGGFVAAS